MGTEFWGNRELNHSVECIEHQMRNMESERPMLSELPRVQYIDEKVGELPECMQADSERESVELPKLKGVDNFIDIKTDVKSNNVAISGISKESSDAERKQDVRNQFNSTYEERLKQTPKEDSDRGEWSGERGESDFVPNDQEIQGTLKQYDKDCITYKNCIPDFSEVSEATVEIGNMTENRADNFRQCDEKCAEQWNKEGRDGQTDWTARRVKEWRQGNGYSWHERNDMRKCDLVPTKVNEYFGHLGGVSECKKRDAGNGGSDFDE